MKTKQVMRTKILFTIFLMTGIAAQAQLSRLSIGVIGFPQISNLTSKSIRTDPVMDNRLSFGGGGGLTVTYNLSDYLGIQLGGFYSAQNQKIRSTYTIAGTEYTHDSRKRFDYIKIPLLLRISQPVGNANFVIFAGPQFSYLLRYDGGMIVYIPDQYFDLPSTPSSNTYYKKYTIDATGGIGFDIPLSNVIDLTTALKVDYSITNAQNNNATYYDYKVAEINGSGSIARNLTYALMVGVNFKFRDPNYLISPTNKFRKSKSKGPQARKTKRRY